MKIFSTVALVYFLVCPFATFAASERNEFTKHDLCEIEGYFTGFKESFMAGIASYPIRSRMEYLGFYVGSQCEGLRKFGIDVANKLKKGGDDLTPNELAVMKKASKFTKVIEKTIIDLGNVYVVKD